MQLTKEELTQLLAEEQNQRCRMLQDGLVEPWSNTTVASSSLVALRNNMSEDNISVYRSRISVAMSSIGQIRNLLTTVNAMKKIKKKNVVTYSGPQQPPPPTTLVPAEKSIVPLQQPLLAKMLSSGSYLRITSSASISPGTSSIVTSKGAWCPRVVDVRSESVPVSIGSPEWTPQVVSVNSLLPMGLQQSSPQVIQVQQIPHSLVAMRSFSTTGAPPSLSEARLPTPVVNIDLSMLSEQQP